MSLNSQAPAVESAAAPESAAPPLDLLAREGINVQDGLARVGGLPATYLRILGKFREGHADAPEQIRQALESDDLPTAERLAHTVRGIAGSIGAQSLFEKAADLEQALRRRASHDEAFQAFRDELRRVMRALAGCLGDGPIAGMAAVGVRRPKTIAPELTSGLAALLREHDSDAVDYLSQHEQPLRAAMGEERYGELESAITNFDFKTAAAKLAPYVPDTP